MRYAVDPLTTSRKEGSCKISNFSPFLVAKEMTGVLRSINLLFLVNQFKPMNRYLIVVYGVCVYRLRRPCTCTIKSFVEAAPAAGGFSAHALPVYSGMKAWVQQKWVNGSAVLIARHGKIVFYKAHGYNDPDTKDRWIKWDIPYRFTNKSGYCYCSNDALGRRANFLWTTRFLYLFRLLPMKRYWPFQC